MVDAVLLDTDVFSYLGRVGDTRAALYRSHLDGKLLGVSFITVGEILFGAYRNKWGSAKLEQINARLRSDDRPLRLGRLPNVRGIKSKTSRSWQTGC